MIVTRFAPSPTGHLHLGHAYAARFANDAAKAAGGKFLLRIEDIDPTRCKPELIEPMMTDLRWLGLSWEQPVRQQSQHLNEYAKAFMKLRDLGVVYPCFCTRKEILAEATRAGQAPHSDDETLIYAGTCRNLSEDERQEKLALHSVANWRLDVAKARAMAGELFWHDRVVGKVNAKPEMFGDVVLTRKDVATSYHLSVTVDDFFQGVTLVTRGVDLFDATHIHRLLQALLGYATPDYHHHPLCLDANGRRYAKRDQAVTLKVLRDSGKSPEDVWLLTKA